MMRIETLVNYAVHANGYVNVPLLVTRGLLTNTRLNKSILFDVRGTGCPFTGDKGTPFGYNTSGCDTRDLLHPDPEKVASLLMRRREFILMAPRRIQSDERLSSGLTPEKYTQTGYDWVRTQTINDVMRRFQPTYSPGVRFFHV